MNRGEFLQGLQNALSGNVPPAVVRENLSYYSGYIRDEVQKGRSEADVMEELGDPRLIARTIMDTTPNAGDGIYEEYRPFGSFAGGGGGAERRETAQNRENPFEGQIHFYDLNKWYWKLLILVVLILVVAVVITVVTGLLTLLAPLLPIVIVVMFIMWFIQRYGG